MLTSDRSRAAADIYYTAESGPPFISPPANSKQCCSRETEASASTQQTRSKPAAIMPNCAS